MKYTVTECYTDGSPFFKETTKYFNNDAEANRYCASISNANTRYYATQDEKEVTIKGDIAGGQNASYY